MRAATVALVTFAILAIGIVEASTHRASLPRLFEMPPKKCYRGNGWTGEYVYCHSEYPYRPGGPGRPEFR